MDAEAQVFTFWQKTLADNEYYDKFKDLVSIVEWLGSNLEVQNGWVETILQEIAADPDIPTAQERAQARERAKDEYLAVMFLVKSDSQRYGALIHDIKNKFTRGSDTCQAMISAAYGYIVNYHPAKGPRTCNDDGRLAFYNEGDNPAGHECSGRRRGGGRWSSGGCGGQGGRGLVGGQPSNEIPICIDKKKKTMMDSS